MRRNRDALIFHVSRHLWPSREAAGLASLLLCSKNTTRSWVEGRRRPPVWVLRALASYLQGHAKQLLSDAQYLEAEVVEREREPRRARGFAQIWERDGPGTVPRDARWHSGRRKQN